jgi:hypothetical protein
MNKISEARAAVEARLDEIDSLKGAGNKMKRYLAGTCEFMLFGCKVLLMSRLVPGKIQ